MSIGQLPVVRLSLLFAFASVKLIAIPSLVHVLLALPYFISLLAVLPYSVDDVIAEDSASFAEVPVLALVGVAA